MQLAQVNINIIIFPKKGFFIQTPWRTLPYPIPEKPFGVRPKKA